MQFSNSKSPLQLIKVFIWISLFLKTFVSPLGMCKIVFILNSSSLTLPSSANVPKVGISV